MGSTRHENRAITTTGGWSPPRYLSARPLNPPIVDEQESAVGEHDETETDAIRTRRHALDSLPIPQVVRELPDLPPSSELDPHPAPGGSNIGTIRRIGHEPT